MRMIPLRGPVHHEWEKEWVAPDRCGNAFITGVCIPTRSLALPASTSLLPSSELPSYPSSVGYVRMLAHAQSLPFSDQALQIAMELLISLAIIRIPHS